MTFANIRDMVMFQSGNDTADYPEFEPALTEYINEGYAILQREISRAEEIHRMLAGNDEPRLPETLHRAIADYGTYMIYRNGNAARQNRGVPYYQMFQQAITDYKAHSISGRAFINLFNQ